MTVSRRWRKFLGFGNAEQTSKHFGAAGLKGSFLDEIFLIVRSSCFLCGGAAGFAVSRGNLFATIAGALCGGIAPGIWLGTRKKARRSRIRRSMPDMVDLLVVCVGAGLGLDQALLRVGEDLRLSHPEIAEELERVSQERQAGAPRTEAWRAFAERARVEELSLFTAMLAETDKYGTPITKALSEFAEELRVKRRQQAEEAAAKTKVKIIFPLVLCIFPSIFIVLLLPALLSLVRNFSGMGH